MSLPGPLPVSPLNAATNQDAGLRAFQRVTAQVLNVTGTTAILAIEGYPVVVQLANSDQAAALAGQKTAQFIITQLTDQVMSLKFVKANQAQTPVAGSGFSTPELAVRLLAQSNIPVTLNNLIMARAVLKQQLAVTPGLLNEILTALNETGNWGNNEASLAAALKAADLPVTAQSLGLAGRQSAPTPEAVANLVNLLKTAAGKNLPEDVLKSINDNLKLLDDIILQANADPSATAEKLKAAVQMLGRSVENILLEHAQNPQAGALEQGLVPLQRLQQMLENAGQKELAHSVQNFIEDVKQNQFFNSKAALPTERENWAQLGFLIQNTPGRSDAELSSARMRIGRREKADEQEKDSGYTHIILDIDLTPKETVQVDLFFTGSQIRTTLTAPNESWAQIAQSELPDLETALQSLGFTLKDPQIDVGKPAPYQFPSTANDSHRLMAVDIEA